MKNMTIQKILSGIKCIHLRNWLGLGSSILLLAGCASHSILTQPELIQKIDLLYPTEAQALGIKGQANIVTEITDQGIVDQAVVNKSSGFPILDEAALNYVKQLKFRPAQKNGQPVSVWMSIVVDFDLKRQLFDIQKYTEDIKRIYTRLKRNRDDLAAMHLRQDALALHEEYIRFTESYPTINYNEYLETFIQKKTIHTWSPLWQRTSLRFLIFYDFIKRYPDTDEARYAKASLMYFFKQDIESIMNLLKKQSSKTQTRMYQCIREFIQENMKPYETQVLKMMDGMTHHEYK